MTKKLYIVCDVCKIPERGSEDVLVYLRKISSLDVQPVRIAERELQEMFLVNEMRRHANLPEVYSSNQILNKLRERERGRFGGLYLVMETDFTLPKVGFTYEKIPKEWECLGVPFEKMVGQTNLGELVKELWWDF